MCNGAIRASRFLARPPHPGPLPLPGARESLAFQTAAFEQGIDFGVTAAELAIGFGKVAGTARRVDVLVEPRRGSRIEGVAGFLEGAEAIGVEHLRPQIAVVAR